MISIITPCYCEIENVTACYEAVRAVMATQDCDYEHLFIDNASTDGTVHVLKVLAASDMRVKVIVNLRNFGPGRSGYHALMQSQGAAAIFIFADLQTPPSLIPDFLHAWKAGASAVLGVRRNRNENFVLRALRNVFSATMRRFGRIQHIDHFCGFGLYDRRLIEMLRSLNEPDPYFRGLIAEVTADDRIVIEYDEPPRLRGKSKHRFYDILDIALLGIVGSTKAPLRLLTAVGLFIALCSIIMGIVYTVLKLIYWHAYPVGVVPVILLLLFLSAVQLTSLGILAEYVGLLLQYGRRFPTVIEKERINFT